MWRELVLRCLVTPAAVSIFLLLFSGAIGEAMSCQKHVSDNPVVACRVQGSEIQRHGVRSYITGDGWRNVPAVVI